MFNPHLLFVMLVIVAILSSSSLQASAQDDAVNLSNNSGESRRVQLFVQGQNVYAVWTDDTPGNSDVFFTKSKNGGASFEEPLNISINNGSSAFPRLVVSEPYVYLVWYDYSPGQSDIFFSRSKDMGKTFENLNIKTPDPSYNPWIATVSNYVYLVWNDGGRTTTLELPDGEKRIVDVNTGEEEIFFGLSKDRGETFEFSNISNSPGIMSWNARIRASDSNVFVVWNELTSKSDIFFSSSSDNGANFGTPINISNDTGDSQNAGIAVSKNNIFLVWNQETKDSYDIFYSKSSDYGKTFSVPINLSNSSSAAQITRDTQIAVSENNVFVVWQEGSEADSEVFFARSVDGGYVFSKPINLSQSQGRSELPQIAVNEENVYVIWHDYSQGNGDIFLRESMDSGATFGSIKNLSNDIEESNIFVLGPQIFLSEDKVYAAWQNGTGDSADIFLKSFKQGKKVEGGHLLLSTLNEAAQIEVDIDKDLDIKEPANLTLRFIDPKTGNLVEDVNYSFEITDSSGARIQSLQNQYSKSGVGLQTVSFLQQGPYSILIDIEGTGTDKPLDSKFSGKASATVTVIPEFSTVSSILLGVIAFSILVIIYQRRVLLR